MAKTKEPKNPTLNFSDLIREMEAYNGNIINFKMGVNYLIEMIEKDDIKAAKIVIENFKLKEVLSNLSPDPI